MQKFGWKCFVGSFVFSLAAVFAATETYVSLSRDNETENATFAEIETRNIELFSQTENLPDTSQTASLETTQTPQNVSVDESSDNAAEQSVAEVADILPAAENSGILYEPEELDEPLPIVTADQSATDKIEMAAPEMIDTDEETAQNNNDEQLKIADAAEAIDFQIPLHYNYEKPKGIVEVSTKADKSQIAMAAADVLIDNLGTENKTLQIEETIGTNPLEKNAQPEEDDPWKVAEVSNSNITKNTINQYTKDHREEVAALDKDKNAPAFSENETKVAYKMVKNLLIPIPDEIMNNENLTPRLAYSEENKKLDEKLQQENILPKKTDLQEETTHSTTETAQTNIPQNTEITPITDNVQDNAPSSKSLTDSITAWFSGAENKSSTDSVMPPQNTEDNTDNNDGTSAFSKLLNLGSKPKSNIAPSELKLAFQPNRAEISGQTLEWLKAFAVSAIKNENVLIEIRIDGSNSFELQQKRLNLLYSILANNGVDFNKINIIFTAREPNSFIIRNVRYASEEETAKARQNSYNPWK